ncbi:phage tail protein [Luteibacter sp. PPL552]
MSSFFPDGSSFAISKPFGLAKAISAISNANPAVATTAAPPAAGTMVVLTSGWDDLENLVARAADPTANSFEIEGVDTSDAVEYPAGQGAGSFLAVADWTTLDQITGVSQSGGDQQYFQWSYVNDKRRRTFQRPTNKNPQTMTFNMDYDPDKPWYPALVAADRQGEPVVLRVILPNKYALYYLVYPSFNETPTLNSKQNMQNVASFALIGPPSRYQEAA